MCDRERSKGPAFRLRYVDMLAKANYDVEITDYH
jgi:hypothetical protein